MNKAKVHWVDKYYQLKYIRLALCGNIDGKYFSPYKSDVTCLKCLKALSKLPTDNLVSNKVDRPNMSDSPKVHYPDVMCSKGQWSICGSSNNNLSGFIPFINCKKCLKSLKLNLEMQLNDNRWGSWGGMNEDLQDKLNRINNKLSEGKP